MSYKRPFDLVLSFLLLLVLAPVMIIIAIVIRIDSQGPIFFRQERVGQKGVPFRIHKFRTMIWNPSDNGAQLTIGADNRITPFGAFLRKYKLDELAQLLDVIRGKMSLVGPRPEVPKYVAYYPLELKEQLLSLKPGLTDWSSIKFRNESELLATVKEPETFYIENLIPIKTAYHYEYLRNMGIKKDLEILLKTVLVVLRSS